MRDAIADDAPSRLEAARYVGYEALAYIGMAAFGLVLLFAAGRSVMSNRLFGNLITFDSITMDDANRALVEWGHKMGPFNRPNYGNRARAHGLMHDGNLVALTVADRAISEMVAGMPRDDLIELARVCASRRDLNRVILRLWREFVFPAMAQEWGATWAVSYQHATMHNGDLYRFDGWQVLGRSNSGTDKRSGRKGYSKVIWGWPLSTEAAP